MKPIRFLVVFALVFMFSCNSVFTPRPRAYFNIDLPQREYRLFDDKKFPYRFEYPAYATITPEPDSTGLNPFWINVDVDRFQARIHLSYKSIGGNSVYKVKTERAYRDSLARNSFESLREEAYKMTYKHSVKASGIVDSFFINPQGSAGVYFYVAGAAATSKQFYITDSVKHFLRGALYFNAAPNTDSLSVVSDFIEGDIKHLLKTLQWN
jgi:gliding motility-associated lipoprotein GldD